MKYAKLKGQQVYGVCPNNVEAMLSGVSRAEQDKTGNVTLIYLDGATEKAPFPEKDIADVENFFEIVGTVQDRARNKSHV